MDDWRGDLHWSHRAFLREVAPVLIDTWSGEFLSVEQETDETKKILDRDAGIDFYHRREQGGLRGVASRIQLPGKNGQSYKTFTVRMSRDSGAKTEYQKRSEAIRDGLVYPQLTTQGYITNSTDAGRLIDFAVCRTELLIRKIDSGQLFSKRTVNAEFGVVPWGSWCELVYSSKAAEYPWWCDPNPGPCFFCGNTTYRANERNSRYACDKCGLETLEPKGVKFKAMPGKCRLDQGFGHDCWRHPTSKNLICRNCGEIVSDESEDTRRGASADGDTSPLFTIE